MYLDIFSTGGKSQHSFTSKCLIIGKKIFIVLSLMILFASASMLPKRSNICCHHWFAKILIFAKSQIAISTSFWRSSLQGHCQVQGLVLHLEILFWRYFGLCAMLKRCYWLSEALWQMSPRRPTFYKILIGNYLRIHSHAISLVKRNISINFLDHKVLSSNV